MESLLQHLLDLLQDPDTQDTLEETARIYFAGTEVLYTVLCTVYCISTVLYIYCTGYLQYCILYFIVVLRASPSTSSRASSSAACCCSASSSSSASASSAVSAASGDDYSAHIAGIVELETKANTKVRNHGEGPY